MLKQPSFIIAGAPRSGTTWLCQALDKHEEISMAKPFVPEPKFFIKDDLYEKGINYYIETWFNKIPDGLLAGEKSTNYLENSMAAERIAFHFPQIKLIFMLRNPVDRAFSNWLWSCHNKKETESFERALELEEERERRYHSELLISRPHSYFSRGLYVNFLQTYYDLFPKENLLCIQMESFFDNVEHGLRNVFDFLEVAHSPKIANGLGKINLANNESHAILDFDLRLKLDRLYQDSKTKLFDLIGQGFHPW
ncbi:MAG: sulfotransferase [Pseudomonadota bacterium]